MKDVTFAGSYFRAGTGLAANYRAACRGRSTPDFIAKLGTAIEEGDEAEFWMEFSMRAALLKRGAETPLHAEVNELVAILVQSRITAQHNMERKHRKEASTARVIRLILLATILHYAITNFAR